MNRDLRLSLVVMWMNGACCVLEVRILSSFSVVWRCVGLRGIRFDMLMGSECLVDRNALEFRLAFSLLPFDLLVLREMLDVLGVVVGLVCLRIWRGVIQFCI